VLKGKSFRCMKSNTENKKSSGKKTGGKVVAKGERKR
jgi:hypothetical protein